MPRKYTIRSKEEKLAIVKAVLSGTPAWEYESKGIVDHHTIMRWVKKYEQEGEAGLETKKKPGNPSPDNVEKESVLIRPCQGTGGMRGYSHLLFGFRIAEGGKKCKNLLSQPDSTRSQRFRYAHQPALL